MSDAYEMPRFSRIAGLEIQGAEHQTRIDPLLKRAVARNASDIHLVVGLPPVFRIDGELGPDQGDAFTSESLKELIYSLLTPNQIKELEDSLQLCISCYRPEICHFRFTVYFHHGNVEASVRVCPLSLRTPEELGLPPIVDQLVNMREGLILVTGATGSGKTTTFNCMIDMINRRRRCKIITVEDPVEYVHENRQSLIVQQQIYSDSPSFNKALVHILRQDPDVIGVGEMRDLETISTTLTAAETGHLVIATLHTPDAAQTIDRIIDAFPAGQQAQAIIQLASCIRAIIAQQLIPRMDKDGRVLVTEVMVGTPGVKSLIRERKTIQIPSAMETGRQDGMSLMDHSLIKLYQQGIISYDLTLTHAFNTKYVKSVIQPATTAKEKAPERSWRI
jgi:twitching motility protein PilT